MTKSTSTRYVRRTILNGDQSRVSTLTIEIGPSGIRTHLNDDGHNYGWQHPLCQSAVVWHGQCSGPEWERTDVLEEVAA